jgi:hypothetical protein
MEGVMLLEQLVEKSKEQPEYDWDSYYLWRFSQLTGREVSGCSYWFCKRCLTVNVTCLPARYGKCRCCELVYLPGQMS